MSTLAPRARDAHGRIRPWLRALERTAPIAAAPHRVLPAVLDELVGRFGDAPALLSDWECLTYRALVERSNRYARWALEQGVGKGDAVGLFMPNRPEYLAAWLGITRIGGVVSLLNTSLMGPALAHCIDIVGPKHVIVAAELVEPFTTALPHLAATATVWAHGAGRADFPRVDYELRQQSGEPLRAEERRPLTLDDRALYIYTSGTTGLPKAANVSHFRLMQWSHWFAGMMDTGPGDRMYNCLPLHHSVGGVVATGAMLVAGGSVVIRDRFSARQFWADVVRWDCTLIQYIGELCRYLLHAEPSPVETAHRVRLACGNGLAADVWSDFVQRFRIPNVLEFYAATEGAVSLFNVEGKVGALGRIPPFLRDRFPMALVKVAASGDAPRRDADGRCLRCAPGEAGEAISRLSADPSAAGRRFEGYTSAAADDTRILRDVFAPGDAWFRTGDLMRTDDEGFYYFVDRLGDTFRWKGENIAAGEVEAALRAFPGVREATVYGVAVPGADGRAGMAALVADPGLELAALRAHLAAHLPHYARPRFLRLCSALDVTATFKHAKRELMREGYDPAASADAVYVDEPERGAFVRLDPQRYDHIQAGAVRL